MGSILHLFGPPAPLDSPSGWQPVPEGGLTAALRHRPIDVVVVRATVSGAVEAVQRAHAADRHAGAVVELGDDRGGSLRRAMAYAPGLPEDLRFVSPADDLVAVTAAAQEQAVRRRRHSALLDSVSGQLRHIQPQPAPVGLSALGTLLEHAPLGVVVTDGAGRLTSWNDQAASMLDLPAEAAGSALADLFSEAEAVAGVLAQSISSLRNVTGGPVALRHRSNRVFELSVAPTRQEDGSPAMLALLIDVTEQQEAERARDELAERLKDSSRAQSFLLKASDVLAQAAGYLETLQALADVAVPTLGDVCVIDAVDDNGQPQRLAARHADPGRQALVDELRRHYGPEAGGEHPGIQAMRDQRTRWAPAVTEGFLRATSRGEEHFQLLRRLGFTGYITVPLVVAGRTLGALTLMGCHARCFNDADVILAEALAGRVAVVVDKARIYDREHVVAVSLQRAMQTALPDVQPAQVTARYVPAHEDTEVGGDWYDVFTLPTGDIALVIGDVVGHDLAAATQMGELRNLLRGLAFDRQEPPAAILARLDQLNDGLAVTEFATLIYGLLSQDQSGGYLFRWVNAGHLPPLLAFPDGTARLLEDNYDAALGLPGVHRRAECTASLPPGSTLLLYTDGLVETRTGQLSVGLPALVQRCGQLAGEQLERFADALLTGVLVHSNDDIATLAVRTPSRWPLSAG